MQDYTTAFGKLTQNYELFSLINEQFTNNRAQIISQVFGIIYFDKPYPGNP